MEYSRLGLTDYYISRIGFGCAPMGGYDYGDVSDKKSIAAVRRALDLGITYFDTADIYGFGHAEEILGKALGKERNKVVIATKFGLKWDVSGKVFRDCSKKQILEAVDGSLRRLKVDAIVLYQLHWHDDKTPIEEILEALEICKHNGKIQHIGCSNLDATTISNYFSRGRFESLQSSYNLLNRNVEKKVLSICKGQNVAFLAHSPLARGFLSGKYDVNHAFSGKDTRQKSTYFSSEYYRLKQNILEVIKTISDRHGKTCSQISIKWILENHGVTSATVGMKNVEQVNDIVGTLEWSLSEHEQTQLDELTTPFIDSNLF